MTNVKWLTAITVLDSPFSGYQQACAYRLPIRQLSEQFIELSHANNES